MPASGTATSSASQQSVAAADSQRGACGSGLPRSPPPSEPDSSMQLSNEFSQEMEMNRVDLTTDRSLIHDQIEKDFEAPRLALPGLAGWQRTN